MASDLSHVNDVRVEDIRSRRPPSSANGTPTRVPPNTDVNDLYSDNGSNSSRGTRSNSFTGDSQQQDQNEGFKEANGGALSTSLVPELAGASQILEKYQVEPFLKAMHTQLQNGGKRSFFGKRAVTLQGRDKYTLEDMLCFQRDLIPTSLVRINADLMSRAMKLFQVVLKYTGTTDVGPSNPPTGQEQIDLLRKLFKHTLKRSELRDELFAQLAKQTRNNPDRTSLLKTWELLYMCSSAMPPGKEFGTYLSKYVHDVANSPSVEPSLQMLALNTWNALKRSAKGGPRRVDLAQEEIEALLGGRKLTIIAFFLDETFEDITYNMATTVSDAVEELAGIIKLSTYSTFSLFECRKSLNGSRSLDSTVEEHVGLDDSKYIGDIVAEFKLSRDRNKGELFQSKLLFEKQLFRESDEAITEPMFVQLSYIQSQYDYLLGNYSVGREDAAQLAALQIIADVGSIPNPETNTEWNAMLDRCLPKPVAVTRNKLDWD